MDKKEIKLETTTNIHGSHTLCVIFCNLLDNTLQTVTNHLGINIPVGLTIAYLIKIPADSGLRPQSVKDVMKT